MIRKWTDRDAVVWLSDEKKEIERLEAAGQCCVYVITEQNRDKAAPKTRWCLELDSGQDDLDAQWLYRVWQRHEGIAWEIARTKRLILREMTEADLDALYEIQSGEDDSPFLEPLFEDRDRQLAQIRDEIRYQYGFYEFGIWIVELAESHTVIGRAGLQIRARLWRAGAWFRNCCLRTADMVMRGKHVKPCCRLSGKSCFLRQSGQLCTGTMKNPSGCAKSLVL